MLPIEAVAAFLVPLREVRTLLLFHRFGGRETAALDLARGQAGEKAHVARPALAAAGFA